MIGMNQVWLPEFVANRRISHEHLAKVIFTTAPWLKKVERLLKNRWLFMTNNIAQNLTGLILLLLAITVLWKAGSFFGVRMQQRCIRLVMG